MSTALPTVAESPEELQRRLKGEPDATRRQRLPALYLLASGQAPARLILAQLMAVHRHPVRAWLTL
jgi:hypothetical protein